MSREQRSPRFPVLRGAFQVEFKPAVLSALTIHRRWGKVHGVPVQEQDQLPWITAVLLLLGIFRVFDVRSNPALQMPDFDRNRVTNCRLSVIFLSAIHRGDNGLIAKNQTRTEKQ